MEENKNINAGLSFEPTESAGDILEAEAPEEITALDKELGEEGGELSPENVGEEEKPEYVPKNKYEGVLYRVYRDEGLSEILRISSLAAVAVTVYAFFVHIIKLIEVSPLAVIELLIITGVPFAALSVMRRMINAPRPYELLEFYERKPKDKAGCSFPSRHVFSVFVIATVITPANTLLGIILFVLGAALAAMRVLLGVHFIRDVVAGALIGVISGAVGLLTLLLI